MTSHLTDITNLAAPSLPIVLGSGRCIYCGHFESEDCICVTCTGIHRGREYQGSPTGKQLRDMYKRIVHAIRDDRGEE